MEQLIAYKNQAPFDRKVFSLSIPNLESFPSHLELPSQHFVLFLACDAKGIDIDIIWNFANLMIAKRVAYLCAWGEDCERVHDIFDEALVLREIEENQTYPHVMTSWHTDDSLDEALRFMLYSAYPDDELTNTCGVVLVVSVANEEWKAHIQKRLSNIELLNAEYLREG